MLNIVWLLVSNIAFSSKFNSLVNKYLLSGINIIFWRNKKYRRIIYSPINIKKNITTIISQRTTDNQYRPIERVKTVNN